MNTDFKPRGVYSAQWIPTDAEGRTKRGALARHMAFERKQGVAGFLALGSSGQFPLFTLTQRRRILEAVLASAESLPVIANVTALRVGDAIELGRHAKSAGARAIALMPPMFYPLSQADILAHFLAVADAVRLPVMLYNFPELTGKKIELATISAFADRASMAAIKQSGGEFSYHRELIALGRKKGFVVMSGADTRLQEVFALGGAGCIGGLVNIVPEVMVAIYRASTAATKTDIAAPAALMVEVGRIVDQLTFPVNVGAGLQARGFEAGEPQMPISAQSKVLYRRIVAELRAVLAKAGLTAPAESRPRVKA
ncbi:dihydrodipicolinate synthase family protein [Opitutus sp. ER46]|uniref:dihydrodipicolinate synthase family protein n=1 Tax=Opitutus sp. ER46 TaxID=2161864 RepID=UPI000D312DE1|nr:dihydrodipicolinate synthase family protein [Opitutus sp. ER46]PTX95703.1 hypothetical protein DB354_09835 [Opitutus sp. ER46]